MKLESLLDGGPHRKYLYGYLDQLRLDHPDWLVALVGAEDDAEYIWIRMGPRGSRTRIIPLLIGRELLAIRSLRSEMLMLE